MVKSITKDITLMSSNTIDAGIFTRFQFVFKNNLKVPINVIRFRIKVLGKSGDLLGYQIGEVREVRAQEVREVEVPIDFADSGKIFLDRALTFDK